MVNFIPSLSYLNDPFDIALNVESSEDKQVEIEIKVILDIVYKKEELKLLTKVVNLVKGNNDINVKNL